MRLFKRLPFKPLLLAVLGTALAAPVFAEGPAPRMAPAAKPAATQEAPVPLLWKVTAGERALYLLGSFHLLRPDDYPLSPDVDAAFNDADALVFEIDPAEMNSPELSAKMAQAGMRTDGSQLDSDLPKETAAALAGWAAERSEALHAMQMSPQVMQMLEPWFASLIVMITEMTGLGLDPALGLDAHLAGRAAEAGKAASGLETGAQQVAFLSGMERAEQVQFLQESLSSSTEEGRREIDAMHAAWRAGDADSLWQTLAVRMRAEYPALYNRINVARNDAWLPALEAMLDASGSGNTLVVAGTLHMLGEDGVVQKLAAKGYQVERICSACRE